MVYMPCFMASVMPNEERHTIKTVFCGFSLLLQHEAKR